jgi:pimeloyl-ACP methyl ester carboxylesterase
MTEFILGMREKYLKEDAKLVIVSHDWGAIIAARLASEANQLADRFIISSGIIVRPFSVNLLGIVLESSW